MIKYCILFMIVILLFSCSEIPTQDNPYDTAFDLPEPKNLGVEDISLTTKKLNWEFDLDKFDGFIISRKESNIWHGLATVPYDIRNFSDVDTPVNEIIQYKVTAYAGENISDDVLTSSIDNTIPAPENFTATQSNVHSFYLEWDDPCVGENGFIIERKIDDNSYSIIESTSENVHDYTDDINQRNTYERVYYRIKTFCNGKCSSFSGTSSDITFSPIENLSYERLNLYTIILCWEDNNEGEDGFKIQKRVNFINWNGLGTTEALNFIDEQAEINEIIQYRIAPYSDENYADYVETEEIDNSIRPVENLNYERLNLFTIDLNWEDNNEGEDGFKIQKRVNSGNWNDIVTTDALSFTDDQAEINETIQYRVAPYSGEDYADYVETDEIDNSIRPVENLNYERLNLYTISLSWEDNNEGEDGFNIQKKVNSDNWNDLAITNSINFIDDQAEVNDTIQYRVAPYSGENYADYIESMVIDNSLPSPNHLNLEIDDENIILSWEFDCEWIDGFRVEKKAAGEVWLLYEDNIDAELRTWLDYYYNNLDSYRIKAFYQVYESLPSNDVLAEIVNMIFVEGSTYEMGDHYNEGYSDEFPVHDVTISSFFIGEHEITQADYESIMGTNPSHNYGVGDNYPVYHISWYDAVEFCNELSTQSGLIPCYDTNWSCDFNANGYRLPTEAEWEYASRGGIYWEDNYKYSGTTEDLGEYAVYYSNNPGHCEEVESKLPNQLGIYDMSGNVYELCWDRYDSDYYETSPEDNPTGPSSGWNRVARGGSWCSNAILCRSANRSNYFPEDSFNRIGFRLARSSY